MGPIVPRQNLPLADREPLLRKLQAGGDQGPVKMLLLNYSKSQDEVQVWSLAIAMKEHWQAQYPGTTVDIISTDPHGGPAVYGVRPLSWDWETFGTVPWLGSPWGAKTGFGHIDGMPLFEEPFQRYKYWAENFDFILMGEQN